MANEVLTDTIHIEHEDGDTFTFRIPSPMQYAKLTLRARALRMRDEPSATSEVGLDGLTRDLYRGAALFELLLVQASVKWPWTVASGVLVVDSANFPPDVTFVLAEVYSEFESRLATFLARRPGNAKPPGGEAVAG